MYTGMSRQEAKYLFQPAVVLYNMITKKFKILAGKERAVCKLSGSAKQSSLVAPFQRKKIIPKRLSSQPRKSNLNTYQEQRHLTLSTLA